jgi:plastocyanin
MKQALLLAVLIISTAAFSQSGSVTGTITVDSPRNTVVYLEPADKHVTLTEKSYNLNHVDQMNMMFQPHVLAVPAGATVEFVNDDSPLHNVMWPSVGGDKKQAHNLGTFATGKKMSYRFTSPGVVPILCNVHPEMSAYILVAPSPYFTVIDNHLGKYEIANVPDGNYNVVVWHEGYKLQSKPMKVTGRTEVSFTLTN